MKPQSTKAKGNLLEDWVVHRLQVTGLDPRAYRQKGSGSGLNKGDVWNSLDLVIECKNTLKFLMNTFWKQVVGDTFGDQKPIVVWHPPNRPLEDSRVVITWEFFEELLLGYNEPAEPMDNTKLKYALQRLNTAIAEVKRLTP